MDDSRLISLAAFGSILLVFSYIVFESLSAAASIPTFHLDGAFQTASGLFRIDSGQAPGRDFYPYLGVGPLLLIFPFFKLSGSTLFASVFAAKLLTMVCGWLAISTLCQLIFRPSKFLFSLVGGAIFVLTTLLLASQFSLHNVLVFPLEPGNSLRPIRAFVPYLAAIATWFLLTRIEKPLWRNFLAGLLTGVVLLWSNDFALSTAMLLMMFFFGYLWFTAKPAWAKGVITIGLAATATWFALLTFLTAGHPFDLMKYNFVDVAKDQWWYFGPYSPSARIFELADLTELVSEKTGFPLLILLVTFIVAIRSGRVEHAILVMLGLGLYAGGVLPSVGGHLGGYFKAFIYWGAVTLILVLIKGLAAYSSSKITSEKRHAMFSSAKLWGVGCFLLLIVAGLKMADYRNEQSIIVADPDRFYVEELGGYLGREWQEYIDYARAHKDSKVVEEYWGVWSSFNKVFSSWPVDSVIHALGEVRVAAQKELQEVDIIVTTRYSISNQWQPWSLSQNFWFYGELLSRWQPELLSPTTIVWRKLARPRAAKDITCTVVDKGQGFLLDAEAEGFFAVTLDYTFSATGRFLLMLENDISYGGDAGGYVSLPPMDSTISVPVLVRPESSHVYTPKPVGPGSADVHINSCKARTISYTNDEVLSHRSAWDSYQADSRWDRGISRRRTGFIVPNESMYRKKYKPGKFVMFENGDVRKIVDVSPVGLYLRIRTEGPILKSLEVGTPDRFLIFDTLQESLQAMPKKADVKDQN